MKKLTHLQARALFILSCFFLSHFAQAQDAFFAQAQKFQEDLNAEFKDSTKSPLDLADFKLFKELPFFPIREKYKIQAFLKRTPDAAPFKMPTNTQRAPEYKQYGIAYFVIDGKSHHLRVFQSQDLAAKDDYNDQLFLPFTDLTSGVETYGGGRYLDLKIPDGDTLVIDFNQSYHPYCAYSHRFSCPLVPAGNNLNCKLMAGVMLDDGWQALKLQDLGFEVRFPDEPTYSEDTLLTGMSFARKRFRYVGTFLVDTNFVYEIAVQYYLNSTCPQSAENEYNECFKQILSEKLDLTNGALMQLRHSYDNGYDTFDFEVLAQGKVFSRFKVILVENRAYIASVVTMAETINNQNMVKFFDSFQMLR